MSSLAIGIVVGAASAWFVYFGIHVMAAGAISGIFDLRRRIKVARLRRQGWAEPRVPLSWETVGPGSNSHGAVALDDFVGAIYDPDPGVPVSQMVRLARQRQVEITDTWIKAVARRKREEAAPAEGSAPFESSDSLA